MTATYLLLHSPLTSALVWRDVVTELARVGIAAVAPDMRADDRPPYAGRYADDVARQAPDGPLVLVAHSGAGALVPLVGERLGPRAWAAVYVDAMLPPATAVATRLELLAEERAETAEGLRAHLAAGGRFPEWTSADLRDEVPDDDTRAALVASLRPRGLDFFTDPIPVAAGGPVVSAYLRLGPAYDRLAADAERRGWPVERLALGHFGPLREPADVASALVSFGFGLASGGMRGAIGAHRHALLRDAVRAHARDLAPLTARHPASLTASELNTLRDVAGAELVARGFGPGDEPTEHGLRCEDLVTTLSPWLWGHHDASPG